MNLANIQLSSSDSSNKILKQGFGTFTVPALSGAGEIFGVATIPHGYTSDNLLFQVSTAGNFITGSVMLPWSSTDNRIIQYAQLDGINLYIYFISSDSSGLGTIAYTVNYVYRILIP